MSNPTTTLTPAQLHAAGVDALARELGPTGMVRFLRHFESGRGDYTLERDERLGDDDVATLAKRIKAQRRRKR